MFDDTADPDVPEATDWAVPGFDRPPAPPALPVLPACVVALREAAAQARGLVPSELDPAAALATTKVLLEAERDVVAARTRALSDLEARQLHRTDGARSLSSWLTQQGAEIAPAQVTHARRLAQLPLIADELASGRISSTVSQRLQAALSGVRHHVDRSSGLIDGQPADEALYGVICHGVRTMVCEARGGFASDSDPRLLDLTQALLDVYRSPQSQLARLEAAFVVLAHHVEPYQLPDILNVLADSLLPLQLETRNRRAELERGLTLRQHRDGSGWRLEGDLDLETGERLWTTLDAELRRDPDNPLDTAQAGALRSEGLDPYDPDHRLAESDRPRTKRERMHDALSRGLAHYLAADLGGTRDKNPVQIQVVVSPGALDGRPGALPARGASGARLPMSLVRRWACDSALTRFVLGLGGRVLEVSHTERTLKAHERRALRLQSAGACQAKGCRRSCRDPGGAFHPHHADPWALSGTTSLSDTVHLCDGCHTFVHQGHVLTLEDGRRLGPDGWVG